MGGAPYERRPNTAGNPPGLDCLGLACLDLALRNTDSAPCLKTPRLYCPIT